jgi:hypothetical protein
LSDSGKERERWRSKRGAGRERGKKEKGGMNRQEGGRE